MSWVLAVSSGGKVQLSSGPGTPATSAVLLVAVTAARPAPVSEMVAVRVTAPVLVQRLPATGVGLVRVTAGGASSTTSG